MDSKRYYWIKLKTDFFEDDKIDFIMSQKNGSEYIVLYQLLCLKSANNNGCLGSKIGDILLKWDEEKIQRECKYFDLDTIRVALSLYRSLGLVYEGNDELIRIANFEEMVGSETKHAQKQRNYRENKLEELPNKIVKRLNREMVLLPNGKTKYVDEKRYGGNGALALDLAGAKCEICGTSENILIHHNNGYSNELEDLYCLCTSCHGKVESGGYTLSTHKYTLASTQEIDIEIEKDIDIKKEKENIKEKKRFCKPTIEEIQLYCEERNNNVDATTFYDFYESKGWKVGTTPMKDWKACVRTWENKNKRTVKQECSLPEFD